MANNKVQLSDGTVLIDLTSDTVTSAAHIKSGLVGHLADGSSVTGTLVERATNSVTYTLTGGSIVSPAISEVVTGQGLAVNVKAPVGMYYLSEVIVTMGGTDITSQVFVGQVKDDSSEPVLQSKTATPTETAQTITADSGYDGLSSVEVGAIPSQYIVPSGTKTISENGTGIDVASYASVDVAVPSGGSSNYVSGTFTTSSSTGTVQTVTIPYTGSGYPIAAMVFIAGGAYNSSNTEWYNSVQRYAVGQWTMHKSVQTSSPTYSTSGSQNQAVTTAVYKNSTSSSTSYTRTSGMNTNTFSSSNASNAALTSVRFKSATALSVYVASTSYGLLAETEYEYHIIYSS